MRQALIIFALCSSVYSQQDKVLTEPFIVAHGIFLASTVFDVEMTHQGIAHHHCVEANGNPYPSRGGMYAKQLGFFAGITAMDLLLQKSHVKFAPYVGAMIGTGKHLHGAIRWRTECW